MSFSFIRQEEDSPFSVYKENAINQDRLKGLCRSRLSQEKALWLFNKAANIASNSKDPSKKVGSLIIDSEDLSTMADGYNGMPFGVSDSKEIWTKEAKKYIVRHAEENAIVLSRRDLRRGVLVVTLRPCVQCAGTIIQSGIKEVWYPYKEFKSGDKYTLAEDYMAEAGIAVISERIELVQK